MSVIQVWVVLQARVGPAKRLKRAQDDNETGADCGGLRSVLA